jgi:hypothetical protein
VWKKPNGILHTAKSGRSMNVRITTHCERRVLSRLSSVVSVEEVQRKVAQLCPKVGETWILVKRLKSPVYIPCSTDDGAVNGDTVWAVVKRRDKKDDGAIVTVLVRRWGQGMKADHVVR